MAYNSTIRQKVGECEICGKKGALTKKQCSYCYWSNIKMKSVLKQEEKEMVKDEDIATLVSDLDIVFSRFIRLKDADLYGKVKCISCDKSGNWKELDCGHFVPRAHMYTRFSELNCHPQCIDCNRHKRGNIRTYAKALELIRPGSVEILQEHAHIVYKYSREELKSMIADYTRKTKQLLK